MLKNVISGLLCLAIVLLWGFQPLQAEDDPLAITPEGEINEDSETVEEVLPDGSGLAKNVAKSSWITVQYIGHAPGMDEYRGAKEDFGWMHTFKRRCKEIYSVKLTIRAWDVDWAKGERDAVYADGVFLGYLHGKGGKWSKTTFNVPITALNNGKVKIWLDIDKDHGGWFVKVDWSRLRVHWACVPPVADFVAIPPGGAGPTLVCFKNLSKCADKYLWDFGDGSTSTKKHPCHEYNVVQKYRTVKLTVWGCGGTDMEEKVNYIVMYKPANSRFAATPLVVAPTGEVQFTNNSGGNVNKFKWDWGDGTVSEFQHSTMSKVHPTHIYDEPGEYNVTLEVSGQAGTDLMTIPGVVYVAEDFLPAAVVETGETCGEDCWENVVNNTACGDNCKVMAMVGDAWATMQFMPEVDEIAAREISRIRWLADTVEPHRYSTCFVKEFDVLISMDGITWEVGATLQSVAANGIWEMVELDKPLIAKFIKLDLRETRGPNAKACELAEIQFFGAELTEEELLKRQADTPGKPQQFALLQNTPNPFNPTTRLNFDLSRDATVTLRIYNMLGQEIRTLVDNELQAGRHTVNWDAHDSYGVTVAGGVYIYTLQIQSEQDRLNFTKKMLLLK